MPLLDLHFTYSLNHANFRKISQNAQKCQKLLTPADLNCFVISSHAVSKRLMVDNEWNTRRVIATPSSSD